jgi:hypothetical protein
MAGDLVMAVGVEIGRDPQRLAKRSLAPSLAPQLLMELESTRFDCDGEAPL